LVFGVTDFRIYREEDEDDVQDLDTSAPIKTGKISDIFGIAQTPNGYTELPLAKDKDDDKEDEEDEEDTDVYQNLSDYIKKYLPMSKTETDEDVSPDLGVIIKFKKNVDRPIQTLMGYIHIMNDIPSFYLFHNTNITYETLNQIVRDLYIQVQYFLHMGFIMTRIPIDSVYYVQGRFIVIDGEHIQLINDKNKNGQIKVLNSEVLRYIYTLMGVADLDSDIYDKLAIVRDTSLFYTLLRIDREGVFEVN